MFFVYHKHIRYSLLLLICTVLFLYIYFFFIIIFICLHMYTYRYHVTTVLPCIFFFVYKIIRSIASNPIDREQSDRSQTIFFLSRATLFYHKHIYFIICKHILTRVYLLYCTQFNLIKRTFIHSIKFFFITNMVNLNL